MKMILASLVVGLLATVAMAQPMSTWMAIIITEDAPFTSRCNGSGQILDSHILAFVYIDRDEDGPDGTDPQPVCIMMPGVICIPEMSVYSYRNFQLESNGTLVSPPFIGYRGLWDEFDSLRVYLRVFFGQEMDSCYTSPVITIPDDGELLMAVFSLQQWTCGLAGVPMPSCDPSTGELDFDWVDPTSFHQCLVTCYGGATTTYVSHCPSVFRPPVIELTSGCMGGCEPALQFRMNAELWRRYPWGGWSTRVVGGDVGCITVSLIEEIPSARLDTMIAVIEGDTVALHWNTLRENTLARFEIWRPVPYGGNPSDHHVADLSAQNSPQGAQYVYRDGQAFSHGLVIAYILVMVDQDSQRFAAAYLNVDGRPQAAAQNALLPHSQGLLSCYPNPFNSSTTLSLIQERSSQARVSVFDITGREVRTIHEGVLEAGEHRFTFDGAGLPSGIYFARLESAGLVKTQKLLLLK
jgi:hypothetical protein